MKVELPLAPEITAHFGAVPYGIDSGGQTTLSTASGVFHWRTTHCVADVISVDASRFEQTLKNKAALGLLKTWLADESGYDEQVWPGIKKAIEEHRLSARKRFRE